jgi:peptide/nickel transport system permease protein
VTGPQLTSEGGVAGGPAALTTAPAVLTGGRRKPFLASASDALKLWRTRVGAAIAGVVVLVAVLGPILTPHSPAALVGAPYESPSGALPLGTDYLGRDVLSRVLDGGVNILFVAFLATVLAIAVATILGLTAGYRRGVWDDLIMRPLDVILAFPALVLALLFVSILGPKTWLIILAVALTHVPQTARVIRSATVQLSGRDFITYAETLGESRRRILLSELLPNITAPLAVEFGLRMTYSIGLVASLAFLGFGQQPPAANWGLMINENRAAVTIQPWPVVLPVLLIALLTIGTNLMTDGFGRAASGIDRRVDA